ncbi:SsgA family sporulation/cell division regulator [Kitasatospora sp. NPDC058170]|uniref:SsgA family sporulation/cell division regulator n=1 Tax=Kitasatospora sp. NPDC058170 TaxID=3346364 RepID=UPI0036DD8D2A
MTGREFPKVPPQRSGTAGTALYLELRVVVCPGLTVPVQACLRYDRTEPYAVYLDSHIDLAEPITWMFARELLVTGMAEWAGMGDVWICPGTGADAETVFISLGGDDASVVLRARASAVRTFLGYTECLVPLGREHEHFDVDGLVRRLLDHGQSGP